MSTSDRLANSTASHHSEEPVYYHRNRRVIIPDGMMAVGLIVGAHGLRGEVRVEPHTDYAERFSRGTTLLMGVGLEELQIVSSRPHKKYHLVVFDGVSSRSDAEALRGRWLFIRYEDAAELDDDHYWIHDLVGMEVQDVHGRTLGFVTNVMETGANDVFIVKPAHGVNRDREILLPAIADVVQSVETEKRLIVVQLMPGLLECADEADDSATVD
jgi:16S rRNA processing protein RimM